MNDINLEEIKEDYRNRQNELIQIAVFHLNMLNRVRGVHASNFRIKDEDHLIDKIKRKKSGTNITKGNYCQEITDLIGIRILHIFKDGWIDVDKYIRENYELVEFPKNYIRDGDAHGDPGDENFEIVEHKIGYRSRHYLLKTKPSVNEYIIEVQVRTIFEEAWAEIDHSVRYPNFSDNETLNNYILNLNRLAGLGDEMGLNIREFKQKLDADKKQDAESKNREEQEYKNKIETNVLVPYYLAKDVIAELLDKEDIAIEPADWYNTKSEVNKSFYLRLFNKNNGSMMMMELNLINGEFYIKATNINMFRLVCQGIIDTDKLKAVYL